jgi:hypothetical protein
LAVGGSSRPDNKILNPNDFFSELKPRGFVRKDGLPGVRPFVQLAGTPPPVLRFGNIE